MWGKIAGYGVVGLLAVALVAGTVYILVRPAEVRAGQGSVGRQGQAELNGGGDVGGYGRGGAGRGQGSTAAERGGGAQGRGQESRAGGGPGDGVETGEGVGLEHPSETWITVSGTVVSYDDSLTIQTVEGEMTVETGPSWYWDEYGIELEAGDEVVLHGFYDGDDFEIGAIEEVDSGEQVTLRDDTGRPLWAGRGRWGR
jgi:hypothetical protein